MHSIFNLRWIERRYQESFQQPQQAQKEELGRILSLIHERSFPRTGKNAAVGLILKTTGEGQDEIATHFLLTRRATDLNHHAGQVSLPGGMVELRSGFEMSHEHLVETLEREVWEETGLLPGLVRWNHVSWDRLVSIHGIDVYPFWGVLPQWVAEKNPIKHSPQEVDDSDWVLLSDLFNFELWETEERHDRDGQKFTMPVFKGWRHKTWGLTAIFLALWVCRISGRLPTR